jgi:CheY-like chemotaxis protein
MKTILVLEDDPTAAKVLRWMLEMKGYIAVETSTAADAISVCRQTGDIDLLIAEVFLSTLSGTVAALRLRGGCPGLPILFVSGTPLEGWREQDFANLRKLMAGRVDFLLKPFTPDTLVRRIDALLDPESPAEDFHRAVWQAELFRESHSHY